METEGILNDTWFASRVCELRWFSNFFYLNHFDRFIKNNRLIRHSFATEFPTPFLLFPRETTPNINITASLLICRGTSLNSVEISGTSIMEQKLQHLQPPSKANTMAAFKAAPNEPALLPELLKSISSKPSAHTNPDQWNFGVHPSIIAISNTAYHRWGVWFS